VTNYRAFALASLLVTPSAFAGLMVTPVTPVAGNVGGYAMTGFAPASPIGGSVTSATSLDGDVVEFTAKNGAGPQPMTVGDTTTAPWWDGATSPFYKAVLGSVTWVELWMPENTLAFSLTLDASASSKAWMLAVDELGNAIDTSGAAYTLTGSGDFDPTNPPFDIRLTGAPKSFGFYADNSGGSCSTISKVVVDPHYWAMGDFSIHVSDTGCSTGGPGDPGFVDTGVPEPAIPGLLGGAITLLGLARRRRARA
jgi:hypothetical protein